MIPGVTHIASFVFALVGMAQQPQKPEDLRLFDYKPVPMLKVLEHPVEHSKFPAINVHTHPGRLNAPDQVARLVKEMDDANVAIVVSLDGMWGDTLTKHLDLLT